VENFGPIAVVPQHRGSFLAFETRKFAAVTRNVQHAVPAARPARKSPNACDFWCSQTSFGFSCGGSICWRQTQMRRRWSGGRWYLRPWRSRRDGGLSRQNHGDGVARRRLKKNGLWSTPSRQVRDLKGHGGHRSPPPVIEAIAARTDSPRPHEVSTGSRLQRACRFSSRRIPTPRPRSGRRKRA